MTKQFHISLLPYNRGAHIITQDIVKAISKDLPEQGIINVFIQHTSAGITINENADPSVRVDFNSFFRKLVPENMDYYTHTMEGSDDMPAHILASIIGSSINIPIYNYELALGMWQGIYLCEFRNNGGRRNLVATITY